MHHLPAFSVSRRAALKGLGLVAAGLAVSTVAPALRVLPALAASDLKKATEMRMQMGTLVEITTLGASKVQAQEAMGRAFEEIDRLCTVFSRYDHASAVGVLNDQGRLEQAPPELLVVLELSRQLTRKSSGAFDMTVAPVLTLLEATRGEPDPAALRAALALVNADRVRQDGNTLRLDGKGTAVTLDGIAKGYIADRAADVLRQEGVEHFLINAGGDIRVQGSPEGQAGGRAWRVAIEDPDKGRHYPATLDMSAGAVATSGGYEVFFNDAKSSHHLVDPTTGASPQLIRSVSVQAPSTMQADGLATALSLMSPHRALELTAMLPQHECLLVTATGAILNTPGWGRERV